MSYKRWLFLPLWFLALFTGAKSFVDNPLLGSRRLNRLGLHGWRVRLAHRLAGLRRRRLSRDLDPALRRQFDANGFIEVRDWLPSDAFHSLRTALLDMETGCRTQGQGDTVTVRVPLGPEVLGKVPQLAKVLNGPRWKAAMSYVAGSGVRPLYYLQAIEGGVLGGPPDPQQDLHADTFQPSMKAWLFLTDVGEEDRPLRYVPGSHRLTPERLEWEQRRSIDVARKGDRLSQRGSLRIGESDLADLGLSEPVSFSVPANTLVVIDTCGFHARAASSRTSLRVEIWALQRRQPFLPWAGRSFLPLAVDGRATWLLGLADLLDRVGLRKQHWTRAGSWRRRLETARSVGSVGADS
ncbi:phytanoyl-CoA dioxygenase family protein [Sphingomonas glaciei]|uniref:Phytanoyl-CoA dioxygenase family protein n=1 Tax=Sphingomonas glaciei TaxID=2938948 RepID=A0ABY5MUG2_9SPHN|nr:phytanoyl-CoA dioxygenase family protein [Sphingomonas glaciei]UUR08082.1 phytanoyl-CoA dioxygenase family protein [Sphingomonas glaciei]